MTTSKPFRLKLLANYMSLVLMAASGVVINILLIYFTNAEVLGRFNLNYSIYIALSQVAVFGLQFSVLQKVSRSSERKACCSLIYCSAVVSVLLTSIVIGILIFFSRNIISSLLDAKYLSISLVWIALALPICSINKVSLSYLNGLDRMLSFSFVQGIRYILMLVYVFLFTYGTKGSEFTNETSLFKIFLWVECWVFLVTICLFLKLKIVNLYVGFSRKLIKNHLQFGRNSCVTGVIMELNTRVDVLTLSLFVSDYNLGIYSFLSTIAEGFYQIIIVVRNFINPRLTKIYFSRDELSFHSLCRTIIKYLPLILFLILILIVFSVIVVIEIFSLDQALTENLSILVILMSAMWMVCYPIVFEMMLNQCNKPNLQTKLSLLVFIVNIGMNFILIPFFDILGAAMATGLSYISMAYFLDLLLKNELYISIYKKGFLRR